MLTIKKRVGTVSVHIDVRSDSRGSFVSGEAYPFGKHFHSVRFTAIREYQFTAERMEPAQPEIGFGGNQFKGEKAARILKAAEVAYEQACYYSELINAFAEGDFTDVVNDMITQEDSEGLIDCLYLTPGEGQEDDQRGLEWAIERLLSDATLLGHAGSIKAESFSRNLPDPVFFGLMKLCSRHKSFSASEGDDFQSYQQAVRGVIDGIWSANA